MLPLLLPTKEEKRGNCWRPKTPNKTLSVRSQTLPSRAPQGRGHDVRPAFGLCLFFLLDSSSSSRGQRQGLCSPLSHPWLHLFPSDKDLELPKSLLFLQLDGVELVRGLSRYNLSWPFQYSWKRDCKFVRLCNIFGYRRVLFV